MPQASNAGPRLRGDALKAVRHRGSHLQIIASAGSGKTEVVAQRVADLFATGVEPTEVVAFTFTDRAAESLNQRIERRVAERLGLGYIDRLNGCFVGTIHAYCFQILQRQVPKYETYDVLDEHRLAAFLSRHATHLDLKSLTGQHYSSIKVFVANLNVVENELLELEQLDEPFRSMVERFYDRLGESRFLTYGQLISKSVDELGRPAILAAVHGQLRHLIVDEYQDINPAQERLIELLSASPVELCVVGDDDQSIYQWRGSDVSNIVEFVSRYPDVAAFQITTNRRSRPTIIESANKFVSTIMGRLPKQMLKSRSGGGVEVTSWQSLTEKAEADAVADAILQLRQVGYRFRDIGVLVRSSTSYPRLLEAFDDRHIPVQPGGRTGLFLQGDAQLFGRTFAFLANNSWRATGYGSGAMDTIETIAEAYRATFELDAAQTADVRARLTSWHDSIPEAEHPANLIRDYYALLAACAVPDWDFDDRDRIGRLGTLARCSAILVDYEGVRRRSRPDPKNPGEAVGGQDRGTWYYFWLYGHIQNWAMGSFEAFEGEDNLAVDAVDLTTVHKAKGLEWAAVFVPSLTENRFPSSKAGTPGDWRIPTGCFDAARYEGSINDERRTFYVAMTRARDWLSLSTHSAVRTQAATPSRFLLEVAEPSPLPNDPSLPGSISNGVESGPEVLSVSFSELARYDKCGFAYRLRNLLGFEAPIAPELGYGKAVHHIMRDIAERANQTGELPTSEMLDEVFQKDFYLPTASKPAHRQLKGSARRLVDNYVNKYSADLLRVWEVERPFELHLGDSIVSGRADIILDREDGATASLAIVDYKTSVHPEYDYGFQLRIYTEAGRREGLNVQAAYVHDLAGADRIPIDVGPEAIEAATARALELLQGLRARDFRPKPGAACAGCDVKQLCRFRATES